MADKRIYQLTQAFSVPSGSKLVIDEFDGFSSFTTKSIDYSDLLNQIQSSTPTLYSANGTLSGTRTVSQAGFNLSFNNGQVLMTGISGLPTLNISSPNRSAINATNNISGNNGATVVAQNSAAGGYGLFAFDTNISGGVGALFRGSQYGLESELLNPVSGSYALKANCGTFGIGGIFSLGSTIYQVPNNPSPNPSHDIRSYSTSASDTNFRFADGSNVDSFKIFGDSTARFFSNVRMSYLRTNIWNDALDANTLMSWDGSRITIAQNLKFPEQIRLGSALETFVQDDSDQPIMSWRKDNRLTKIHQKLQLLGIYTSVGAATTIGDVVYDTAANIAADVNFRTLAIKIS